MKIEYDEKEKMIRIKDLAKFNYFMLIALMVLVIVNAILTLKNLLTEPFDWYFAIWIITGITALIIIIYQVFKKSAAAKIKLHDIVELKEKTVLGRNRFSLKLKNGKFRDVCEFKSEIEIAEMKSLFEQIGIKTSKK